MKIKSKQTQLSNTHHPTIMQANCLLFLAKLNEL